MNLKNRIYLPDQKFSEGILLVISLGLYLIFGGTKVNDINHAFVILYTLYTFLRYVNNLGHTINIFDFLTFYSALDTLLSPLISYIYFDKTEYFARIWGAYMRVPEDRYFGFLIPANLALFAGVHLFFNKRKLNAKQYVENAKAYVANKSKVGFIFVGIGIFGAELKNAVPDSITFVFYLLGMLTYVGGFYLYFSIQKRRGLVLSILFTVFFLQSVQTGLFGEFAMFAVMAASVILAQYRIKFLTKLLFFSLAIAGVVIVQSVKADYRAITWSGVHGDAYEGQDNVSIFSDLVIEKVTDPPKIFNERSLFYINRRFNQGFLISGAMNYVPRVAPYADGETIWSSLAAVLVPRFLWPDKPEAGGRDNLTRFLGVKKRLSYSMNIGPYGEGYGNFGPTGGAIFIFIYSLLISFFLDRTLKKTHRLHSLIIWIPLLFFYVLTVETDILTTINSLVKTIVFIWLIYWGSKKYLHVDI